MQTKRIERILNERLSRERERREKREARRESRERERERETREEDRLTVLLRPVRLRLRGHDVQ